MQKEKPLSLLDLIFHQPPQAQNTYIEKKHRLSIFEEDDLSASVKRRKFLVFEQLQSIKHVEKYEQCECITNLKTCQKVNQILHSSMLKSARDKYEHLKLRALNKMTQKSKDQLLKNIEKKMSQHQNQIPQVLVLPLRNLLILIDAEHIDPLLLILKHAKVEYISFWVYARLIAKWPNEEEFLQNILKIADKNACKLQFSYERMMQIHKKKATTIIKGNYIIFIRLFLREKQFTERVTVAGLMKGRERTEDQIIRAALNLQSVD